MIEITEEEYITICSMTIKKTVVLDDGYIVYCKNFFGDEIAKAIYYDNGEVFYYKRIEK